MWVSRARHQKRPFYSLQPASGGVGLRHARRIVPARGTKGGRAFVRREGRPENAQHGSHAFPLPLSSTATAASEAAQRVQGPVELSKLRLAPRLELSRGLPCP